VGVIEDMVPASIATDPEHWRKRAEEARTLADKMNDPVSKEMMLGIAKDYERLAERAEQRSKNWPRSTK
jgi:CRISPR/Cas system-associated protein Csm6